MKTKLDDMLGGAALTLLVSHAVLIILSWLLSAMGQEDVRSLLSSEGIRWFVGSFSAMTASPLLVWLLLLLSAAGCVRQSGVASLWGQHRSLTYRERIAFRVALFFLVGYVVIVGLLTLVPHAILLSATGQALSFRLQPQPPAHRRFRCLPLLSSLWRDGRPSPFAGRCAPLTIFWYRPRGLVGHFILSANPIL